jgi:hypothetical protein
MADPFDEILASELAPPKREGDRAFGAQVQSTIAIEERLAAQRRSVLTQLVDQLIAIGAVGAALWWIGRAEPVATGFAQSPALGLAILLTGFGLLVALMSKAPPGSELPN